MSYSLYIERSRALAEELIESLGADDVAALRTCVAGMSAADWRASRRKYAAEFARFVAATPAQRQRGKDWQDQEVRLLWTLAGIHHCLEAARVLEVVDDPRLTVGCSYRSMAANAGFLYQECLVEPLELWPFEPPDPFVYD